jgi:hypothetical protein
LSIVQGLRGGSFDLAQAALEAQMLAALGRVGESRARFLDVVRACPDYPGAQALLARLVLPGPPYRDVLARLHRILKPDTYLEIGVESGATLSLAFGSRRAIGVDPTPCPLEPSLPSHVRVYRMESDAFFRAETRESTFDGAPVSLAFVDGMHLFEHALRDFANVERWSAPGGTIVLHDCLPVSAVAARRDRASTFWVGDVWKALEALLDYRPDLRIAVVPTAPSGLVVVRGLDPTSTLLADRMAEIVERYRSAEYPHAPGEWPARYVVVENSDEGLARAVSA